MTFWMRPQCSERIHIGCVSILIMVILLLYFRTALPPSGKSMPLVGKLEFVSLPGLTFTLLSFYSDISCNLTRPLQRQLW